MDGKRLIEELESLSSRDLDKPVVVSGFLCEVPISDVSLYKGVWGNTVFLHTGSKSITGRQLLESFRSFDSRTLDRDVRIGSEDLDTVRVSSSKITLSTTVFLGLF